ncbi:hypothetical protein PInf_009780 [Phytophthora infestans]|nr:hypothetical protein PInf_009780 [Phytophthora infestans]
MGRTMVIPGIGGTGLPAEMTSGSVASTAVVENDMEGVALFTNPQGVVVSSGDASEPPPKRLKPKAAVKQAVEVKSERSGGQSRTSSAAGEGSDPKACFHCGKIGHWSNVCPAKPKCFACGKAGHFARSCPDTDAKARNDAYLVTRKAVTKPVENE